MVTSLITFLSRRLSSEKHEHFVGISESVGHAMTFKILTDNTLKVIHQSNVRSALNLHTKNL